MLFELSRQTVLYSRLLEVIGMHDVRFYHDTSVIRCLYALFKLISIATLQAFAFEGRNVP